MQLRQLVHAVAVQRRPPARRRSSWCRRSGASAMPWRASTSMSYLMLWPILSTAGSSSSGFSRASACCSGICGGARRRGARPRDRAALPAAAPMAERDVAGIARRRSPATDADDVGAARRRATSVSRVERDESRRRKARAIQRSRRLERSAPAHRRASTVRRPDRRRRRCRRRCARLPAPRSAAPSAPEAAALDAGDERAELIFSQEGEQRVAVGLAARRDRRAASAPAHRPCSMHQIAADPRHFGVLDQRLAALGLLDLACALQQRVEIAIDLDQLAPRSSRRCPARPAHCRSSRRPAPARRSPCPGRRRISPRTSSGPIGLFFIGSNMRMPRPDELHQVLVGGDDGDLGAGLARAWRA